MSVLLLTRYGLGGALSRDEAVYAYAGQQVARGVPPFASIFDPKGPGAGLVAGAAVALAHVLDVDDLLAMRVAFLLFAVGTGVVLYLLATRLFGSVLAGVTAAVTMATFHGWAFDALSGPDAKVPGIFFAALAMLLLVVRRPAWAAAAGSLAALVWQPLFVYPTLAVVLAGITARPGRRLLGALRVLVAAAVPMLLVVVYALATGTFADLVQVTLVFPLVGISHGRETALQHVTRVLHVVDAAYGQGPVAVTFWVGALLLAGLCAVRLTRRVPGPGPDPLVWAVGLTGLLEAAYALVDFQGYPDVYPLLAYPALGMAGGVSLVLARPWPRAGRVLVAATTALLLAAFAGSTAEGFADSAAAGRANELRPELSDACAVQRLLGSHGTLWALGDPTPLVLTDRTNPDRYIYLGSAVDRWKEEHTVGGLAGWEHRIAAVHPALLVRDGWYSHVQHRLSRWLLHDGYVQAFVGTWRVFLGTGLRQHAHALHVLLTRVPTALAPTTCPVARQVS